MRLHTYLSLLLILTTTPTLAQNLPNQHYLSESEHIHYTGGAPSTGLYNESTIREVNLQFTQGNYWNQLSANYGTGTNTMATMTADGEVLDSVGVRFKGQTSYFFIPNEDKKSFAIATDEYNDARDWMGYSTLNFNNWYLDPSGLREVFFLNSIRPHIPAAQANWINLSINGQDWGVYVNVQQINKDFLEEWFLSNDGGRWRADTPNNGPPWGDGTAALNYHGDDTTDYQNYYTLKSSDISDPWTRLAEGCSAIANTPTAGLVQGLDNYLDIDRTLWFLGSEILFSDDDGYVYKGKMDYYVYYEPETGRLVPLEYDGNTVMEDQNVDWSPFHQESNANYPLCNRLFNNDELRQRYLAHLRVLIEEALEPTSASQRIQDYADFIDAEIQSDPKKLSTYNEFTSEIGNLQSWVQDRYNTLMNNPEVAAESPVIASVVLEADGSEWGNVVATSTPAVTADLTHSSGISEAWMYYTTELVGSFTKVQMLDDGQHNDGTAGDGIYGAALPAFAEGTMVRFYVEAVANNTYGTRSYSPPGAEHDVYYYIVNPATATSPVVINELMASNSSTASDEAGEFDDWIELYNNSSSDVDLSGWYLSDNGLNLPKFALPAGTTIPANGYLIVWADEDGSQGDLHANFKLSSGGETVVLSNASGEIVDQLVYGALQTDQAYARNPNGTGDFQAQSPTYNDNNDSGVGLVETKRASSFHIYPNPAHNAAFVRLDNSQQQTLKVYNALGVRLLEMQASNTVELALEGWIPGIYTIQVGAESKRLVITK